MELFSLVVIILLLILPRQLVAQNQLRGYVVDSKTKAGIEGLSIINRFSGKGTISGSDGYFSLRVEGFPVILNFSHLAYERTFLSFEEANAELIQAEMIPRAIKLDEIMIRAKPYIDLIDDKPLFIREYEFVGDKILLLANRDINSQKPELLVTDHFGNELATLSLNRPEKIVRDCYGQIHVLNYFNARQIGVLGDSVFMMPPVNRDFFHSWMDKAYLAISDTLILRQMDKGAQELTYSFIHKDWTEYQVLRSISNRKTVEDYEYWEDFMTSKLYEYLIMQSTEMLDSLDFNYLGLGTGALTGGSHVIGSAGRSDKPAGWKDFKGPSEKLNLLRHTVYHQQYLQHVSFVDAYAPLFEKDSSLIIFNCVDNQIEIYDRKGRFTFMRPMDFHLSSRWAKKIIQDPVSRRFFTLYSYGFTKTLKEISAVSGEIVKSITLPQFPHMTDFKVYNGSLYFLYTKKIGGIEEPTHLYKVPLGLTSQ